MDYIVKRASSLSSEDQILRGISGIPQSWVIEKYIYVDIVPDGFELITDVDLLISISNNQAAYDAWLTSLRPIQPPPSPLEVTTQYEKNDKDLTIARAKGIVDPVTRKAITSIKVPGIFGSGDGRYVSGGYGFTEDYNADDYAIVYVEDTDRYIAWAVALALDPNAIEPLSDATIIAAGTLPAPINEAFPNYPIVKSYTEDEAPEENRGWYFYPNYIGNNLCSGEVEVNPIGGYAFIPSGFYLVITYQRPVGVTTGVIRVDVDWGKKPL